MKKRLPCTLIVLAVLILVMTAAGLWYTRPMTLEQFGSGIKLSECTQIRVYYYQRTEDSSAYAGNSELTLTPESPEFSALLAQFQGRTFRRSLLSLLPRGTRTHVLSPGDFSWEVLFSFENVPMPSGSTVSGPILQCKNYFGKLDISLASTSTTWRATTAGQSQWLSDVMAIINAAQES